MEAESERSGPLTSSSRRRKPLSDSTNVVIPTSSVLLRKPSSSLSAPPRKPLSDSTNLAISTSSVLRKLSSSLAAPPPFPNPVQKPKPNPNGNSKPYCSSKTKPDANPSKSDNTSIGSSSHDPDSAQIAKTPTRACVADSGNRSEELIESIKVYKRRETADKTKDKGKAVDGPLTYSSLRKTKDSENSDAMPFSPLLQKTKDKRKAVAVPFDCSLADKRRDKGKAIAVSFSHLGKTKDNGKVVSVSIAFPPLVNTRNKSKAFDMPFSCPPLPRTKKIRTYHVNASDALLYVPPLPNRTEFNGVGDVGLSKSRTVPPPNNKKERRCLLEEPDVSTHALPQEFVELQRAYFKDVDDFELAEEEVSESELDHEGEKKCYNHDEVEAP
ncbi:hypothetical protein RHMOL_Rhmol09G0242300 [Rhododendron molle]|uniref:Uncharacterized protein n=1 Tax=Rhododendron molle TaxID=49168 RepID=A0ACC0MGT3_RHOML|nr:hypothetical protein RHMOL_Rhmol09G0242300 [Rhododendron molle]